LVTFSVFKVRALFRRYFRISKVKFVRWYTYLVIRKVSIFRTIFSFLPHSRDDALLFAGQFTAVLEIVSGVIFEIWNLKDILHDRLIYAVVFQLYCFIPLIIAIAISAIIIVIKKL
jgi:hypothetical protein